MKAHLIFILLLTSAGSFAQSLNWNATNSPSPFFRFEDVYFLNPDTGYAVHYYDAPFPGGEPGYIMKTVDAGANWIKVLDSTLYYFRDIGFTDAMHGWAGTIDHRHTGADTNIVYQTLDGGATWQGVPDFPGPDTAGICGMQVINDSTVYGVGRYPGPAGFYKTTNNGISWSYTNIGTLAGGLVDLHFFNPDTGYAVGFTGLNYHNGYARVIYTTDGGNTWDTAHTSTHRYTLGWKIVFPSRNVGYSSMESFAGSTAVQYFLKTTDGGISWQEVAYNGGPANGYNVEGIGFVNDTVGWVGGDAGTFETQDGGITWTIQNWGTNVNRFRFFSDALGYCAGQRIYKMIYSPSGISEAPTGINLLSYPNPSQSNVYFEFFLFKPARVKLAVYDALGKEVALIFDEKFNYGNQHFTWSPEKFNAGIYICKLTYDNQVLSRRIEVIK